MTTPDFNYKPDATILSAFQNANQQRMQANELKLKEKQQNFDQIKQTTEAVSGLVTNMVTAAEKRKTNQVLEARIERLSRPKAEATVPVQGPMLPTAGISEGTTVEERPIVPNPEFPLDQQQRRQATLDIAKVTAQKELGEQAAKAAMGELYPDANKLTMANRSTPTRLELPDGQQVPGFFDPTAPINERYKLMDGSVAPPGTQPGYAAQIMYDENGAVSRFTKGGKETSLNRVNEASTGAADLPDLQTKAPKIAERVNTVLNQSFPETNKFLQDSVAASSAAAQVGAILKAEGEQISQVGLKSLGFYFARMSGSNSQLSDSEREIFQEPLALLDKVWNKGYKIVAGDLSPQMKKDLQRLAKTVERRQRMQGEKTLAANKQQAKSIAGQYWSPGIEQAFPTMEQLIVGVNDIMPDQESTKPGTSDTGNDIKAALKQILPKVK